MNYNIIHNPLLPGSAFKTNIEFKGIDKEETKRDFLSNILPVLKSNNKLDNTILNILKKTQTSKEWKDWFNSSIGEALKSVGKESNPDIIYNKLITKKDDVNIGRGRARKITGLEQIERLLRVGRKDILSRNFRDVIFTPAEFKDFNNHPNIKDIKDNFKFKSTPLPNYTKTESLSQLRSQIDPILNKFLKDNNISNDFKKIGEKNTYSSHIGNISRRLYDKPVAYKITTKSKDNIPSMDFYFLLDNLPPDISNNKEELENILKDPILLNNHTDYLKGKFSKGNTVKTNLANTFSELADMVGIEKIERLKGDNSTSQDIFTLNTNQPNTLYKILDKYPNYVSPLELLDHFITNDPIESYDNRETESKPLNQEVFDKIKDQPAKIYKEDFINVAKKEIGDNARNELGNQIENALNNLDNFKELKSSNVKDIKRKITFYLANKFTQDIKDIQVSEKVANALKSGNPDDIKNYFYLGKDGLSLKKPKLDINKTYVKTSRKPKDKNKGPGLTWEHKVPSGFLGELTEEILEAFTQNPDNIDLKGNLTPKAYKNFIQTIQNLFETFYKEAWLDNIEDQKILGSGYRDIVSKDENFKKLILKQVMDDGIISSTEQKQLENYIDSRYKRVLINTVPLNQVIPGDVLEFDLPFKEFVRSQNMKEELRNLFNRL